MDGANAERRRAESVVVLECELSVEPVERREGPGRTLKEKEVAIHAKCSRVFED